MKTLIIAIGSISLLGGCLGAPGTEYEQTTSSLRIEHDDAALEGTLHGDGELSVWLYGLEQGETATMELSRAGRGLASWPDGSESAILVDGLSSLPGDYRILEPAEGLYGIWSGSFTPDAPPGGGAAAGAMGGGCGWQEDHEGNSVCFACMECESHEGCGGDCMVTICQGDCLS